jgi:ubiquinone/menaquinone biosynthesis C-methylase UbiE
MEVKRKPFEGVSNIMRFNWHFYVFALVSILLAITLSLFLLSPYSVILQGIAILSAIVIIISLGISYYIYDVSRLYEMQWLPDLSHKKILIVNAGFDEISLLVHSKFPQAEKTVIDFYNPLQHTEVSIARARKAYPSFPGTISVSTEKLILNESQFDVIIAMLSTHEIRSIRERIIFFRELNRVLKNNGQIFVTEHLRDLPNFLAYTVGFFHFHSKEKWMKTFEESALSVHSIEKTTPFISTFILNKNGNSL